MWIKALNIILEISYIIIWSSGYYTQVFITIKEKNGEGYSLNFQLMNLISAIYLLIYSLYLLTIELNFVTIMDTLYSIDAVILITIIIILTFYYPRKINKLSLSSFLVITVSVFFILFYYFVGMKYFKTNLNQFLLFIGFSKLNMTVIKYVYQIFLLYDRKNTYGLSYWNFLSDLIGGFLSLFQQFIASYFLYSKESFNITRFALGIVTVVFDIIILYQYFFVYKKRYNDLSMKKNYNSNDDENEIIELDKY